MNKDELRELLHQEYKTENWKKVTEFVFPNVQYLQRPQAIPFSNDKVESFKQIGNVKLTDGKNLAMFEVKVAPNVNLTRNKVELRKLVENLIDQERNHGVLVIYEQGKEDYRFTFTAKSTEFDKEENDFIDLETDAKRFTYILGKNESCKTAANRFWELSSNRDKTTIKDVENAFSVERLNKEFFNKYKDFYEDFVQYITGKRFVKEKGKWVEKKIGRANPIHKTVFDSDDKLARNFVKLLLGRLIFIQFLQKKGWMGVPSTYKQWKNGDPDFLLNLYNHANDKDEFHSKWLYSLFYKAFNTPNRPNDVFNLTGSRVPYLNGGLFENENPKTKGIDFPATFFANLFDFFGQYNFTIDENDPLDHEVGIDPEMLGHIFENLLEDNKDKGAFYTPKPIVQYMCQESLIQYIKTYLQEHQIWPKEEEVANQTETHIQNFVRKKIAGELLNDYDEQLARALKEVKICDPAIGSGAFPMGLMNEIFYCMQVLHDASPDTVGAVWEMEEWAPDIVKKNIIQHSIYGVDIDKGAVDIARLRFWLSLIVEEQEPTPLPNLDFKIMQGNSLLESYEGIDLSKIVASKTIITEVALDLFGKPIKAQTSIFDSKYIDESNISELIDDYFNTKLPNEKQNLKKEIDKVIRKHIDFNLEFEENRILISMAEINNNLKLLKGDINHSNAVASRTNKAREKLLKEFDKVNKHYNELKINRKDLHDLQKTAERPYFLWHLFFKDVFDKGGFDIVIGNPPYLSAVTMARNDKVKRIFSELYPLARGSYDLYILFLLKGIQISKKKGVYTWIIPNKFLIADYAKEIKSNLINSNGLIYSLNVSNFNVFNGVGVYPIILIGNKCAEEKFQEYRLEQYSDLIKRKLRAEKSLRKFQTLKDFGIQIQSGATGFQAQQISDMVSSNELKNSIPFAVSGNIDRYKWNNKNVRYMKKLYSEAFINNNKNSVADSKWEFWSSPKIIISGMTKVIEAVYEKEPLGIGVGIYGIYKFGNFDPLALTAILNSKFLTYYFTNKFKDKHLAGGYLAINKSTIEQFPLVAIPKEIQIELASITKELQKQYKKGNDAYELELKVDLIVYKLYDIPYSEIIEHYENFPLNEIDYNKFKIKY